MRLLALLAFAAQVLDGATWLIAVRVRGLSGELNPLAVALGGLSPLLVFAIKVWAGVALAAIVLTMEDHKWFARLPALVGLLGAATNVLALL